MDISVIDEIYKSHNIYKALFICKHDKFHDYLQALKINDYPISLITDTVSLNNNSSRILFISNLDIEYLELMIHKINFDDFTIQVNIDCDERIEILGDIQTIFI